MEVALDYWLISLSIFKPRASFNKGNYVKIFMRTNKQKKTKCAETRSLKIQPKTRTNKYGQKDVPEIKLCGEWLKQLGFEHGTRVTVTLMREFLIIRPDI